MKILKMQGTLLDFQKSLFWTPRALNPYIPNFVAGAAGPVGAGSPHECPRFRTAVPDFVVGTGSPDVSPRIRQAAPGFVAGAGRPRLGPSGLPSSWT